MKKILAGLTSGVLAMGIFAGAAFAEVTYDSTSGQGFVGKGDVQTALGLNNAQIQGIAETLEFTYESIETYQVVVEWTTNEGKRGQQTHQVEHKKTSNVTDSVSYDSKVKKQVVGFNLTGITGTTFEGVIPQLGEEFPGNSGHVVTAVNLVSSTSTLYVNGVPLQ